MLLKEKVGLIMTKRVVKPFGDKPGIFVFYCEGCDMEHVFYTQKDVPNRPTWAFNNSEEKPTLHPSLLIRYHWGEESKERCCHSFITDGNIRYLNDCTHHLAGKTVPLLPIDEYGD